MADALMENIYEIRRQEVADRTEGVLGVLIRDTPLGSVAGAFKDDPVFGSIMETIYAETEAELGAC